MQSFIKSIPLLILLLFIGCASKSSGIFENSDDIGNPALKGDFSYNSASQTYTLSGAGDNIWSTNDQFRFAWKKN